MGHLKFMFITGDPELARFVHRAGVERIFVDLEVMGKIARQGHLNTWRSDATMADVAAVRQAAPEAELMVRINPLHDASAAEINEAITHGADVLMLPMYRTGGELAQFLDLVAGRVRTMPLAETVGAVEAVEWSMKNAPPDEMYFGLNDLHLDAGLDFMFQPLSTGMLEKPADALRSAGIPFGIGGIARAGDGIVSPEFLLGEHVRLGSEWVVLSRGFHGGAASVQALQSMNFEAEVEKLRGIYRGFQQKTPAELAANASGTAARIDDVVRRIRQKRDQVQDD